MGKLLKKNEDIGKYKNMRLRLVSQVCVIRSNSFPEGNQEPPRLQLASPGNLKKVDCCKILLLN